MVIRPLLRPGLTTPNSTHQSEGCCGRDLRARNNPGDFLGQDLVQTIWRSSGSVVIMFKEEPLTQPQRHKEQRSAVRQRIHKPCMRSRSKPHGLLPSATTKLTALFSKSSLPLSLPKLLPKWSQKGYRKVTERSQVVGANLLVNCARSILPDGSKHPIRGASLSPA